MPVVKTEKKEVAPPKETILEPDRAQNISIFMKRNQFDLPALVDTLNTGTCKPPITLDHIEKISPIFVPSEKNRDKLMAEREKCISWTGYTVEEMDEGEAFLYTIWTKCPNIGTILPLTLWIEDYYAKLILVRKGITKMQMAMDSLKSWQIRELITYVIDVTNILAEEVNKKIQGFQINSLLVLTDMKSQKNKTQTMMNFLADQLELKNPELLPMVDQGKTLCEDALSSIMVTQLLFPDATSKYYEIANMIRELDPETNQALLGDMKPFVMELHKVILELNDKLQEVDQDISYFGGIFYDELTWGANVNISDLGTVWKKLMGPGILLSEEANGRILRDCTRYVFFSDMLTFLKSLSDAKIANADAKKKAEAEKRMAEKKAANEKARAEKMASQHSESKEGADILSTIKANIEEEKIVEETRNIASGQMVWRRMALRQKIASAVTTNFSVIPGSGKDMDPDYHAELKVAFDIFDKKATGSLSVDVLGEILWSLGQKPTPEEVKTLLGKIDENGNGTIELNEFVDFMVSGQKASETSLKAAFCAIDENGNGKLDKDELKGVLEKLGECPTEKQIEYLMRAAGECLEGEVDFEKFVKLMNCDFS